MLKFLPVFFKRTCNAGFIIFQKSGIVNHLYLPTFCQSKQKRVMLPYINRIVEKATQKNEPSLFRGKRLKFYYATQITTKPPTFVCFVNYPQAVHFSYKRYLMNQLRLGTGLDRTPIRLIFRQRTGRLTKGNT